jgi:hypothetical protein
MTVINVNIPVLKLRTVNVNVLNLCSRYLLLCTREELGKTCSSKFFVSSFTRQVLCYNGSYVVLYVAFIKY